MLLRSSAIILAVALGPACGAAQHPKPGSDASRKEIEQLTALYTEARAKFVVQKQKLIDAPECSRATYLRETIDIIAEEAAMQVSSSENITLMQMELKQAEQDCLAKL